MAERKLVIIRPDGPQGNRVSIAADPAELEKLRQAMAGKSPEQQHKAETILQAASDLHLPVVDN